MGRGRVKLMWFEGERKCMKIIMVIFAMIKLRVI